MRIRIAVHRYRPDVGGTELMAEMMATSMVRLGHEVEIVTLRTQAVPPDERLRLDGTPAADGEGYRVRRLEYFDAPLVRFPVGYWGTLWQPADVLHVFGNRIWCSDFFLPVAKWLPMPAVLTGQDFFQLRMHPSLVNRLYAERYFPWAARRVNCYVVQTEREGAQIRRFGYGGPIEKIPHTVDPREFPPDDGRGERFREEHGLGSDLVLLSAGGYAPNKRMDRVIEAVARAHHRWRLVVVGGDWPGHPADYRSCVRTAERLGVQPLFLGEGRSVPRDEVVRAFYACDAYAQGSSYEGYGGAVQEAMLLARPFVAFETGAMGEFEAAGAGRSVRTLAEFSEALDAFASSENLRRQMGEAGRRDVLAHRCVAVTMAAYDRVFRRVASGSA